MRSAVLLTILALVTLSLAEDKEVEKEKEVEKDKDADTQKDETYTDRFDSIDFNAIIANRRLLVPYLKCVLDKGRCTPEGKELKIHVRDAMQTACKKCTDKQKAGARKVVNHIRDNEPIYWDELTNKFDSKGEYKPIYEPFLSGKD